jgi:glucosylceramidase
MAIPAARRVIEGVGVQWAGKNALPEITRRYPDLPVWSTEWECGYGTNDWKYANYSWEQMKLYFGYGARVWQYWNMALPVKGRSSWGWPQNSLITVDADQGNFVLNPEYWVLRHLSVFVKPGADRIPTAGAEQFDDQLAFRNPNGEVVIVLRNQKARPVNVLVAVGERLIRPTLAAESYNTVVMPPLGKA